MLTFVGLSHTCVGRTYGVIPVLDARTAQVLSGYNPGKIVYYDTCNNYSPTHSKYHVNHVLEIREYFHENSLVITCYLVLLNTCVA